MPRNLSGIGVGLRRPFAQDIVTTGRQVDFLEIVPENWVKFGGWRRRNLLACLERWPIIPHSVSLSIGGPDPLDEEFLSAIAGLCQKLGAPLYSDHVCYSGVFGSPVHDLLPLPFSEEAIAHVVPRIRAVQARVDAPVVLENATFYAHMPGGTMDEATFLRTIIEEAGCGLLLDVNNVYVNSKNHGFEARAFIDRMPLHRVAYLHVAGHTVQEEAIIDTHIGPVIDDVWALYRYTLRRAGRLIPTLIEWDQEIPELDVVLDEVDRARAHARQALLAGPEMEAATP